jgi:hypothetical protein
MKKEKYFVNVLDEHEVTRENIDKCENDPRVYSDGEYIFVTAQNKSAIEKEYGLPKFENYQWHITDELINGEIAYEWNEIANDNSILNHLYNIEISDIIINSIVSKVINKLYHMPEEEALKLISCGDYREFCMDTVRNHMIDYLIKELKEMKTA